MICMNRLFDRALNEVLKNPLFKDKDLPIKILLTEDGMPETRARLYPLTLDRGRSHTGHIKAGIGSMMDWTFNPRLPTGRVYEVTLKRDRYGQFVLIKIDLNNRDSVTDFWANVEGSW